MRSSEKAKITDPSHHPPLIDMLEENLLDSQEGNHSVAQSDEASGAVKEVRSYAPRPRPTDLPLFKPEKEEEENDESPSLDLPELPKSLSLFARCSMPPPTHSPQSSSHLQTSSLDYLHNSANRTTTTARVHQPTTRRAAIADTKDQGEGWATDAKRPKVFMVEVREDEDTARNRSTAPDKPGSKDTWVPRNYGEATFRPDLWGPPHGDG